MPVDVPESTQEAVGDLAEKHGVQGAARLLKISREAVTRIVGDLPIRAGTLALVENNIVAAKKAPVAEGRRKAAR
jgi:hypothetical protein